MKVPGPHLQSGLTLDKDLFEHDVRRTVRIAWLAISILLIQAIATAADNFARWQLEAIALIVVGYGISAAIEGLTGSVLSYLPITIVLLVVPILFASDSSKPWVSYGLVIVAAVTYAAIFRRKFVALGIMYLLIILQYVVAKKNYPSVSDTDDLALLGSYFSTLWCALVGIGALVLKFAYLKYSNEIEEVISKISLRHEEERQKAAQINLRDYENSQLHATVLNTLIAIRNSPQLLSNSKIIQRYLRKDLAEIERRASLKIEGLREWFAQSDNLPIQRDISIDIQVQNNLVINESVEPIVVEIVRELVLNIKKHTLANKCNIDIQLTSKDLNPKSPSLEPTHYLIVEITDNSNEFKENDFSDELEQRERSESIKRLLKAVDGDIDVHHKDNEVRKIVTVPIPVEPEYYLQRIVELREQSIHYIALGYIRISLIYALLTFPAYVYLGISSSISLFFAISIILAAFALYSERYSRHLAQAGASFALISFPLIMNQSLDCSELLFLPWYFNGVIGIIFLAALLTKNLVLKWLPVAVFFYVSALKATELPAKCSQILDGSIPGIVLISLLAIALGIARKRDLTFEARFISEAKNAESEIIETRERVLLKRSNLMLKLASFEQRLPDLSPAEVSHQIQRMILLIKAFLLTSEYFHSNFAYSLYEFVQKRFDSELDTIISINTEIYSANSEYTNFDQMLADLLRICESRNISVIVSGTTGISIDVAAIDGSSLPAYLYEKNSFRVRTVSVT